MTDRAASKISGLASPPSAQRGLAAGDADRLADLMFALATPSRLQILACLDGGPLSVSEIVERVGMEQSAVSHQLRTLREHEVVSVERRGRHRLYALRTAHVGEVLERARAHLETLRGGAERLEESRGHEKRGIR